MVGLQAAVDDGDGDAAAGRRPRTPRPGRCASSRTRAGEAGQVVADERLGPGGQRRSSLTPRPSSRRAGDGPASGRPRCAPRPRGCPTTSVELAIASCPRSAADQVDQAPERRLLVPVEAVGRRRGEQRVELVGVSLAVADLPQHARAAAASCRAGRGSPRWPRPPGARRRASRSMSRRARTSASSACRATWSTPTVAPCVDERHRGDGPRHVAGPLRGALVEAGIRHARRTARSAGRSRTRSRRCPATAAPTAPTTPAPWAPAATRNSRRSGSRSKRAIDAASASKQRSRGVDDRLEEGLLAGALEVSGDSRTPRRGLEGL